MKDRRAESRGAIRHNRRASLITNPLCGARKVRPLEGILKGDYMRVTQVLLHDGSDI